MTKNTHSSGNWIARGDTVFVAGDFALSVAVATRHRPEFKENAKIIAAAPDLLAALEDALPLVEELVNEEHDARNYTIDRVRAAIAKARSEI